MIKPTGKTAVLSLIAAACLSTFTAQAETVEDQALLDYLNSQTGMTAQIHETQKYEGYTGITIQYQQPVDHHQPNGEQFTQHMVLMHKDSDTAMSLETKGYSSWSAPYLYELASSKHLNQLSVEHRYFGQSVPQDIDWSTMTIEQAADDMHRIVEAIRPFYDGKWISTGTSKGGMTAMYHRYYHPEDVDATLANGAPMSFGRKDHRYVHFLENVGTESCRNKIMDFQRAALERKDEVDAFLATLPWWNLSYEIMPYQNAYEKAVAEYYFYFFQGLYTTCDTLPAPDASAADFAYELTVGLFDFSDMGLSGYQPYFYQAYTQLGYPELPLDHISDLLQTDPNDYRDYLNGLPQPRRFDRMIMRRVNAWTTFRADNIMLVYGDMDPWGTGQFRVRNTKRKDNYKFILPGGDHGASIFGLPAEDKAIADAALAKWLDLPEETQTLQHILRPVEQHAIKVESSNPTATVKPTSVEAKIAKMKDILENPEAYSRRGI